MAMYRMHAKYGKAGFASPHSDYINREGKYSKGTKKEELIYKESGNLPKFCNGDSREFWKHADAFEKNRRAYKEYEIALPTELSNEENKEIVKEYVEKTLGKDFPYTYAIHSKNSSIDGVKNIHAHIMFSERKHDGIERDGETFFKRANTKNPERGGAKKDTTWQKDVTLLEHRKLLADIINNHLKKANCNERVTHKSLKKQHEEALNSGDIDKAEMLNRKPQNLERNIYFKIENGAKLNEREKLKVRVYEEAKEIRKEKVQSYKKSLKLENMPEDILRKEYLKTYRKLKPENLLKSAMNSVSGGYYYTLLNRSRNLNKSLERNPGNEIVIKEIEKNKLSIAALKNELKDSPLVIAKSKKLEENYTAKKEKIKEIMQEKYMVTIVERPKENNNHYKTSAISPKKSKKTNSNRKEFDSTYSNNLKASEIKEKDKVINEKPKENINHYKVSAVSPRKSKKANSSRKGINGNNSKVNLKDEKDKDIVEIDDYRGR